MLAIHSHRVLDGYCSFLLPSRRVLFILGGSSYSTEFRGLWWAGGGRRLLTVGESTGELCHKSEKGGGVSNLNRKQGKGSLRNPPTPTYSWIWIALPCSHLEGM